MDRNLKRAFLGSLVLHLISITALFFKINDLRAELLMSISGKVIDYDTGKGIPNIAVIVNPYHWTKTDKDGNFIISDLPAGRYTFDIPYMVSTISEYYVPYKYPEVVEVPRGKNVTNIKIYLRKGGEASGRVLAEDGVTPIKGAWVDIGSYETQFYAAISALFSHAGTIKSRVVFLTDEQGRFKLKGLLEGFSFDIRVMAYGYAFERIGGFQIKYGEELNIGDIVVGRRSKSIIRGKVYSSTNMTPIVGAEVWIIKMPYEKEYDGGWALTDSKGEFQVKGLSRGYYSIGIVLAEKDRGEYQNPGHIFDLYISESKDNFIEIKVGPNKKDKNSKISFLKEDSKTKKC